MFNLTKQQGAAIIVALFVTSLVAIAAIAMIDRLRINLRSTALLTQAIAGNLSAQGSIAWAIELLNTNQKKKKPNQLVDLTPIKSPINREDNAVISTIIFDAQGRFNLNNLGDPAYQEDFIRLIMAVSSKTDVTAARAIADATMHWISGGAANNTLDEYYLKSMPPYRAPHRLMVSVSEFRLVKGVSAELFAALSPFITALPETTSININNTTAPVLMSLSPTLTRAAANTVAAKARQVPFASTQDFLEFDVIKNNPMPENKITVLSSYFLVKSSVKVSNQETLLYTLLQRMTKDAKPIEMVLWQSKGTL